MKILVIGASKFIGSHLITELIELPGIASVLPGIAGN